MPAPKLTDTEKQVMLFLYRWFRPIRIGDLKTHLKMKHSTLNSIIRRLQEQGLVSWVKYGPVELTDAGKKAVAHFDKHAHVIASFLQVTLEVDNEWAKAQSFAMAQNSSCELINMIISKLGLSECRVCGQSINDHEVPCEI